MKLSIKPLYLQQLHFSKLGGLNHTFSVIIHFFLQLKRMYQQWFTIFGFSSFADDRNFGCNKYFSQPPEIYIIAILLQKHRKLHQLETHFTNSLVQNARRRWRYTYHKHCDVCVSICVMCSALSCFPNKIQQHVFSQFSL